MRKLLIITLSLLTFSISYGQYVKEFSQDTALYADEISAVFGSSLIEEDMLVFNQFLAEWDSMEFGFRKDIMEISELMRQRSCRLRPQYIDFVKIMKEFHVEDKLDYGYSDWKEGYISFLTDKATLIKDINKIQQNTLLMLDKSSLYKSVTLEWRFETRDFRFTKDLRIKATGNQLVAMSGKDSIIIHEVEGYLDPIRQQFFGSKGKVYWERAGFERDVVYADLGNYTINLKEPGYAADTVVFTHTQLLAEPALGRIDDRITQIKAPENAKYPQFFTYQGSYELDEIVPGLNFRGGLSMQGANLAGTELNGVKAKVEFFNNDTLRIRVFSNLFLFNSELVRTNNAQVSIYLEQDSIYHPDLILNYNIAKENLRLTKSKDYNSLGPYANSYHRIDMTFDELNWVRTDSKIYFQAALGTALGNGMFESYDFFDLEFYENLQGMEYQHPLADLWTFGRMIGGSTFAVLAFSGYMGKDAYMIRHQLMQFSKLGFVYFDFDKDEVTLRPKLYDYIDASLMKRDYDVIRFMSRTSSGEENATLDLNTKDLAINGIPTIFLSDSQNVQLVPTNNQIIMKRNRDFQFDGVIDAGLFKFYGKNFFFEYDAFLINLQNIDSLSISAIVERDAFGNAKTTTLDNKIENITGELLIDAPFNKSGMNHFPEYPIFTSRENSYVYFDELEIQAGVYDRDRFYFQLLPFSIDSLDNFRREAMRMDGTFVSADILPPLEMEMSLRPDNSLGFYMTTPEEGIPIFNGNATFYNDIEMSSAGLHGYGSMDYITSTTWSDDFLFHPDSMMTTSRRFLEREKIPETSYPYVENEVAQVRYYPFQDVMNINRMESTFKIFNDSVVFGGNLALKPSGLTGYGGLAFPDARLDSDKFAFKARKVLSDSAGVKLRKAEAEDFTLTTNDVKVNIDLDAREGDFTAREDYTLIDFPANLYETRLNQVTWFMDRDEVLLTQTKYLAEQEVDIGIDSLKTSGPSYVSKHPQQDSLNFVAPLAYFNYGTNVLSAKKVPFMEIGDSYIFPHSGDVEIVEKAKITPLREAKLLANFDSRYHLLHHADLVVDSRQHFRGSADYDYVDEFETTYTFRMTHVEVDTSINTFGIGDITAEEGFMLSPFYAYQGEVHMSADNPLLTFAGGVQLTYDCDIRKQWLKFETEIDPDSILIPIEEKMMNLSLNNIYAGTLKARDSAHIYPSFFSARKDYFDRNVTFSDSYLYFNKNESKYELASIEKMQDMDIEGNYLSLSTDSCELYSEGDINLQLDYGRIGLTTVGYASHDVVDNTLDLNLIMGMDFHFSPEALHEFGTEIDSLPNLEPVDLTTRFYQLGIRNLVGEQEASRLETELGLYGKYTLIPDSLQYSILFNDMKLKWNQETRSYRYNGKVGIGSIGDVQVNKKVDAYIEFVERGSGDIFDIYLMVNPDTWYYMAYSPGGFQVLSSNSTFNSILMDMSDKDRRLKGRGRTGSYIYSVASNRRLGLFLDRFMMFEQGGSGTGE